MYRKLYLSMEYKRVQRCQRFIFKERDIFGLRIKRGYIDVTKLNSRETLSEAPIIRM